MSFQDSVDAIPAVACDAGGVANVLKQHAKALENTDAWEAREAAIRKLAGLAKSHAIEDRELCEQLHKLTGRLMAEQVSLSLCVCVCVCVCISFFLFPVVWMDECHHRHCKTNSHFLVAELFFIDTVCMSVCVCVPINPPDRRPSQSNCQNRVCCNRCVFAGAWCVVQPHLWDVLFAKPHQAARGEGGSDSRTSTRLHHDRSCSPHEQQALEAFFQLQVPFCCFCDCCCCCCSCCCSFFICLFVLVYIIYDDTFDPFFGVSRAICSTDKERIIRGRIAEYLFFVCENWDKGEIQKQLGPLLSHLRPMLQVRNTQYLLLLFILIASLSKKKMQTWRNLNNYHYDCAAHIQDGHDIVRTFARKTTVNLAADYPRAVAEMLLTLDDQKVVKLLEAELPPDALEEMGRRGKGGLQAPPAEFNARRSTGSYRENNLSACFEARNSVDDFFLVMVCIRSRGFKCSIFRKFVAHTHSGSFQQCQVMRSSTTASCLVWLLADSKILIFLLFEQQRTRRFATSIGKSDSPNRTASNRHCWRDSGPNGNLQSRGVRLRVVLWHNEMSLVVPLCVCVYWMQPTKSTSGRPSSSPLQAQSGTGRSYSSSVSASLSPTTSINSTRAKQGDYRPVDSKVNFLWILHFRFEFWFDVALSCFFSFARVCVCVCLMLLHDGGLLRLKPLPLHRLVMLIWQCHVTVALRLPSPRLRYFYPTFYLLMLEHPYETFYTLIQNDGPAAAATPADLLLRLQQLRSEVLKISAARNWKTLSHNFAPTHSSAHAHARNQTAFSNIAVVCMLFVMCVCAAFASVFGWVFFLKWLLGVYDYKSAKGGKGEFILDWLNLITWLLFCQRKWRK